MSARKEFVQAAAARGGPRVLSDHRKRSRDSDLSSFGKSVVAKRTRPGRPRAPQTAQDFGSDGCSAANVSEFDSYNLVYQYDVHNNLDLYGSSATYVIDHSASTLPTFTRRQLYVLAKGAVPVELQSFSVESGLVRAVRPPDQLAVVRPTLGCVRSWSSTLSVPSPAFEERKRPLGYRLPSSDERFEESPLRSVAGQQRAAIDQCGVDQVGVDPTDAAYRAGDPRKERHDFAMCVHR